MDKQAHLQDIARQLERPVQSLQGLSDQPVATLETLQQGIEKTLQSERDRLEAAYQEALPRWLYQLIMPWLRRNESA